MRIIITNLIVGLVFFNIFQGYSQNDIEIKGILKSKQNDTVIPFASILDITTYKHGTTSKEDGTFFLKIPYNQKGNNDYQIKIECLGFRDTIINTKKIVNNSIIRLAPQVSQLPEVVIVAGDELKVRCIGLPKGALLKNGKGEKQGLIPNNSAGFSSGVFVRSKKNQQGWLKSVSVYLLEKGFPRTPFSIRILVSPKNKIKRNRMYSSGNFIDYLKEPIVFKGKSGWNNIEIEEYNVPIPENDFLILFTPLDSGKEYRWSDKSGEWYGMVIGVYKKKKISQLFWAIKSQGFYSYDDTPNQRNFTPAVVIHYYTK